MAMRRAIGACVRSLRVRPCRCATSLKRLWAVPWTAANFWRVFVHRNGSLARSLCWGVRRELTSQNGSAAWSWANGQRGLASARLVWADKAGISGSGFSESPDARQGVCIDHVVARPLSNLGFHDILGSVRRESPAPSRAQGRHHPDSGVGRNQSDPESCCGASLRIPS